MGRIRVMIAEDERAVRESLRQVVASDPAMEVVATAEDAERAIDLAVQERPDVALLDVRMPGGGGPRAAREIGRRCPPTRLVALSAFEDRDTVLTMLRAGALSYIVKGASNEEILQAIHRSAQWNGDGSPLSEALRTLDEYEAQQARADRRRTQQIERIQRVLERHALRMVFQPIFSLPDRQVAGVEALARMHASPRRTPDLWFAEAEGVGMLIELELAAVRAAFARLGDIPTHVYLAVNLSPTTAASQDFLETLEGMPAERIVVEITEHAPVDDYEMLNEALDRLRARGARVAIDDVGAGFASLRHIVRLAPDIIKVDITLTNDVDNDRTRQALVSALIGIASKMGATVVAEGVETRAQLETLQSLGVRAAQGFYLARPGPLRQQEAKRRLTIVNPERPTGPRNRSESRRPIRTTRRNSPKEEA